jgi:hypothetical protein
MDDFEVYFKYIEFDEKMGSGGRQNVTAIAVDNVKGFAK